MKRSNQYIFLDNLTLKCEYHTWCEAGMEISAGKEKHLLISADLSVKWVY